MPSPAHAVAPSVDAVLDLERPYRLHPKVALRPERFGALAYSYDTRRLSLLKDLDLVAAVRALAGSPTAGAALAAVPDHKRQAVLKALARLVEIGFVQERPVGGAAAAGRGPSPSESEPVTSVAAGGPGEEGQS